MTAYPTLFSPIEIGGVPLRNRIAHASIVTRFVRNGEASEELLNYYANRARGGTALIVSEPVAMISLNRNPNRLRAYDDAGRDTLCRVVEACEQHDTRLLGQLQDPGRGRHEIGRNDAAIGVSALPDDLSWTVPHVLSPGEIRQVIDEWAAGCARLKAAGFAGVELSAGHGHLYHQFLSPWSNRREDEYGGDVEGRTRFLRELIAAIRSTCGRPFMICAKLPGDDGVPGSIDLDEAERIAGAIAATGEVDVWTFAWGAHANSLWTHLPNAHGPRAPYLGDIRRLRRVAPDIASGALSYMTDPNEAEHALTDGTADVVFLGRPLITEAAWGEKARTGREAEIRYCVSCNTCWRSVVDGSRLECDNNPRVAAPDEADWHPPKARARRRVVVVGSGIAGLEAAWVAAARGHEVTLFGAADEVGGKTRLHALLPGGENLSSIYDYQYLAGKRHGVRYELGVPGELDNVAALEPDVVVLATGARMLPPDFVPQEYLEEGLVLDVRTLMAEMHDRTRREDGRILLLDRDHTEMTYAAAERLSELFEHVTIVTPRDRLASDCALVNRQEIYQRLYDRHVQILTSCEPVDAEGLEDGTLRAVNVYNGDSVIIPDIVAITYSTSRAPNDALRGPLEARGIEVQMIGDCYAPRSVLAATRHGYQVGMQV